MGSELRDCVSGICMKEEMRRAVIEHVREGQGIPRGEMAERQMITGRKGRKNNV